MLARISALAVAASVVSHSPAGAAASDFEGRWIRDCGMEVYCRILLNRTGPSSFDIFFVVTQPSTKGTPLQTDPAAPDPAICEWNATMRHHADTDKLSGEGGFSARIDGGKLSLSGIPPKCGEPDSSATFERDDADEFGDI